MKRNRWKNRLSLLLVALMLFTTLAPVALAVGEPEAITKVTEPAESDKVSEDQNEPPAPAPEEEDKLDVSDELKLDPVAEGNETKIVFKNGETELKTVPVTDAILDEKLTRQGAPVGKSALPLGNSTLFVGWSDQPNYNADDYNFANGGHLFYDTDTFRAVENAGLIEEGKTLTLYAMYVGYPSTALLENNASIRINEKEDGIEPKDFVGPGNPVRGARFTEGNRPVDPTTLVYNPDVEKYEIKKLDAVFTMNPFVAAAVYKDPWNGALDRKSDEKGVMTNAEGDFTVIDLHVSVDKRIKLPDTFKLTFHSYVFRPVQMFSGNYEMIGVGSDGTVQKDAILDSIVEGDPDTTFTVQSFVGNANEKTPIHDFILRTRVRTETGQDGPVKGKRIANATMGQIKSEMHLTFSSADDPFTVLNKDAQAIAEGKANGIDISGYIQGQVRAVMLAPGTNFEIPLNTENDRVKYGTQSEIERLLFIKGETPKPPVNPPVEPPVVEHKTISVEKIWEDGNDEAKKRPDSITVKLLANGEDTGKRLVLSAKDNWKGSFYGLDYTKDGKTIEYTVAEIGVKNYESKVSGSDKSGYIITNTVVPEKPAPAPTPEIKLPKIPHIVKPLVVPTIPKAGVGR